MEVFKKAAFVFALLLGFGTQVSLAEPLKDKAEGAVGVTKFVSCNYPSADAFVKADEVPALLVLTTKKEQNLFYQAFFGTKAPRIYEQVRFYRKPGSIAVAVVLIDGGCTVHIGKLTYVTFLKALEAYKGKIV